MKLNILLKGEKSSSPFYNPAPPKSNNWGVFYARAGGRALKTTAARAYLPSVIIGGESWGTFLIYGTGLSGNWVKGHSMQQLAASSLLIGDDGGMCGVDVGEKSAGKRVQDRRREDRSPSIIISPHR